jgi:excisionase family DNA binding protein
MPPIKYNQERRALRPKQASVAYGVGRVTLYKWMNSGKLASVKIGGARLIPVDALEALLQPAA